MVNLTPETQNHVLPGGCVIDVLENPFPGSHPVFIWRHGGGGETGDHYRLWVNGQVMNRFAGYLNESGLNDFDIVSIGSPQWEFSGPTSGVGHLDTLVNPSTGVSCPAAIDAIATGISETVSYLGATGCVLGGFSWGALLMMAASLKYSLPVDGVLVHYGIPDVRRVGGDLHTNCVRAKDVIYYTRILGLCGATTLAEHNAVDPQIRKEASAQWYLETGRTSNFKPFYVSYAEVGDHKYPHGDPARPAADVHDSLQNVKLVQKLQDLSLSVDEQVFDNISGWESSTEGDAANAVTETWMNSVL